MKFGVGQKLKIADRAETTYGEHRDETTGRWISHRSDGTDGEEWVNLKNQPVRVCSQPYEATTGDHRGKTMYPCALRDEAGGAVVSVPEDRLKAHVGFGRRVFGGLGRAWARIDWSN